MNGKDRAEAGPPRGGPAPIGLSGRTAGRDRRADAGALEAELGVPAGRDAAVVPDVGEAHRAAAAWAVALQVLVTAAPEGRVSPAVQPFSGVAPAVTRTVATKPPFH